MNHGIDLGKKLETLKKKKTYERESLRYKRLISEIVKIILSNNDKRLSNNDIKTLSIKIYKKYDKLKHTRVRNQVNSEIVKKDVNNELQRIYTDAGLSKEALKPLLESIKMWIEEKKDITNALKLVERIERANNLEQKPTITARTTETTDFSKIGKDGLPAQKVVKTLEVTQNAEILPNEDKSEAIRDTERDDQEVVDSKP